LRKTNLLVNVEIIGINGAADNSPFYNQVVSAGRTCPWLQDTVIDKAWTSWGVTYRDVRLLDSSNRLAGVYNLTTHDLGNPAKYEALKAMFIALANGGDSDQDRLPDHWEERYLKGLSGDAEGDPDGDTFKNYLEFAFGSDPLDPASRPDLRLSFNGSRQFTASIERWAGAGAGIVAEVSTNLLPNAWFSGSTMIRSNTVNLYDGTGRGRSTFLLSKPAHQQPAAFLRLNARR